MKIKRQHLLLRYHRQRLLDAPVTARLQDRRNALLAMALGASLAGGTACGDVPEYIDKPDVGLIAPMPNPDGGAVMDAAQGDSAMRDDGGEIPPMPPPQDAGEAPPHDGGEIPPMPPPRDAGEPPRDGGEIPPMPPPRDTGTSPRDTGTSPRDTGTSPRDTGISRGDIQRPPPPMPPPRRDIGRER